MILELDCGNTRIKWRVREGAEIHEKNSCLTLEGLESIAIAEALQKKIERVWVSSVLDDEYSKKIVAWSLSYLGLNPEFAVSELSGNGVSNGYQQPEKLGVDRWLGILAARARSTEAFVVIDCGSAITVDVVTSQGEHLGGYIAPGLKLMREALNTKTNAINLGRIGYPENPFPGRNTVLAIKAAELIMISGLVIHAKNILQHYEMNEPSLWITGGDGEWLSSVIEKSVFIEDLVLDGLEIALDAEGGQR
ncbi:MAG TPA: type III pantothenate kinase [Cellvibrio sp.]|nr:type III pantothenate kinase [Cellvibrio sp.]